MSRNYEICRKGDCEQLPTYTLKAAFPREDMHVCGRHVKWVIDWSMGGVAGPLKFEISKYRSTVAEGAR